MSDELTRDYGATNEELQEHLAQPEGSTPADENADSPATASRPETDDPEETNETERRGMPGYQ